MVTLCAAWMLAASASASERGEIAAQEVSQASYQDYLENWLFAHAGDDRGFGTEHDPARDNIAALFGGFGLTVELDPFQYYGNTYYNVVATKLGTTYPDQIYIVGAHYDSVNNPGADDDASGVALMLEAARIISQYDSDYTIRFIAFDREEQGLVGSSYYVYDHVSDDIVAMIQADMVAYDPGTDHALIYCTTNSIPLKDDFALALSLYGDGLTSTYDGPLSASDHAPFESAGFQALLLIEGEFWSNPHYHKQSDNVDTPGNINYPYAIKMTRSVVGYVVDHAGVDVPIDTLDFTYPDGRPEWVSPAAGTSMRVEVTGLLNTVPQPGTGVLHYDAGGGWQSAPMNVVTDNVYDAVFPAAACGTEIAYYVSAEDTTALVYTDPESAPGVVYAATAAYGNPVLMEETLDADPGWTMEGAWQFGQPTGGGGQYGYPDPTSGHTGDFVYGFNLSGDYRNDIPAERYLTTITPIDCTGGTATRLTFWRWLGVDGSEGDYATVRVSNDGSNWTTVWEKVGAITDYYWTQMDIDISNVADNEPTVYLRWTMGPTDRGYRYCGWNIDDIRVTALQCAPSCVGDVNGDSAIDLTDLGILLVDFGCTGPTCIGDVDGNSETDLADLLALMGHFGVECE